MLRLGILFFLLQLACTAQAQKDSVLLKPVVVYGIPVEKYLAGSTIESLDTAIRESYNGNHLGEILSFQFPIYFRNYGNGMVSGISMRGTGPNHTAVLWNGININNFSLGQADFSLLPSAAFDQVKVHTGGGSAHFGSGAFGGAVLLQTGSDENSQLDVNLQAGSFGRYFTSAKASFLHKSFAFSSSFYRLQSENNFRIQHNDRQQHAAFLQQGIVQHIQYTISPARSIRLDYWFHDADREIQPNAGSQNNTDEQQDRNHRLVASYQQNNRYGLLKAGGGIVDDNIIFNGSKSNVQRWVAFANHEYRFSHQWNVRASVDWNHITGKVKEYGGEPEEDRVDIAASLQKEFRAMRLSFNLRQPFIPELNSPLLPYLGTDIFLAQTEHHFVQFTVNASKNFRAPTFNERYWENSGREDLLPETSYATEAGLSWKYKTLKSDVSAFYQLVDEWIQWVPDAGGRFRPENIKQVSVKGIAVTVASQWKHGKFSQNARASYQLTRSITEKAGRAEASSIGKQLIYTPVHTASAMAATHFKKWTANIFLQYSGKRFTESSNTAIYSLRPFVLADLSFGRSFISAQHVFNIQAAVKNILNTNYQLYSGLAMPGRYYNLQITYQLKKNKPE